MCAPPPTHTPPTPPTTPSQVLLRALRDFNTGKLTADDAGVFAGLLGDLFPGLPAAVPRAVDARFEAAVRAGTRGVGGLKRSGWCVETRHDTPFDHRTTQNQPPTRRMLLPRRLAISPTPHFCSRCLSCAKSLASAGPSSCWARRVRARRPCGAPWPKPRPTSARRPMPSSSTRRSLFWVVGTEGKKVECRLESSQTPRPALPHPPPPPGGDAGRAVRVPAPHDPRVARWPGVSRVPGCRLQEGCAPSVDRVGRRYRPGVDRGGQGRVGVGQGGVGGGCEARIGATPCLDVKPLCPIPLPVHEHRHGR